MAVFLTIHLRFSLPALSLTLCGDVSQTILSFGCCASGWPLDVPIEEKGRWEETFKHNWMEKKACYFIKHLSNTGKYSWERLAQMQEGYEKKGSRWPREFGGMREEGWTERQKQACCTFLGSYTAISRLCFLCRLNEIKVISHFNNIQLKNSPTSRQIDWYRCRKNFMKSNIRNRCLHMSVSSTWPSGANTDDGQVRLSPAVLPWLMAAQFWFGLNLLIWSLIQIHKIWCKIF